MKLEVNKVYSGSICRSKGVVIMEPARFSLRIHPVIMKKMKVIAENNGRSVNKEIEQILKWVVDDYENQKGKIKIDD